MIIQDSKPISLKPNDNFSNIIKEYKSTKTQNDLLVNCKVISKENFSSKSSSEENMSNGNTSTKRSSSSSLCSNSSYQTKTNNHIKKRRIEIEHEDSKERVKQTTQTINHKGVGSPKDLMKIINDEEDEEFLNFISYESITKTVQLKDLSDQEFLNKCCLSNVLPSTNLSTCSHQIKCFVKTLAGSLTQYKLKWMQDIVIGNECGDELDVYIGNDPLTDLLQLTCEKAKELFKQFKESGESKANDENCLLFERKRNEGQKRLRSLNTTMHLKFDITKLKYCIYKID